MRASQETRNYLNLDGLVSRDRRAIDQKAFFGKMLSQFACRELGQVPFFDYMMGQDFMVARACAL